MKVTSPWEVQIPVRRNIPRLVEEGRRRAKQRVTAKQLKICCGIDYPSISPKEMSFQILVTVLAYKRLEDKIGKSRGFGMKAQHGVDSFEVTINGSPGTVVAAD